MEWIEKILDYVFKPANGIMSQVSPSWSWYIPTFVKGLLFPPLAGLYRHLDSKHPSITHLQTSIKYAFAALATTSLRHPSLPHYQQRLAISLRDRYRRLGDAKDLRLALMLQSSAASRILAAHMDVHWHCENLMVTYRELYSHSGDDKHLETMIKFAQSVTLEPTSPRLGWWQQSLSEVYQQRYARFSRAEDAEAALEYALAAVDFVGEDDPILPGRQNTLGSAYNHRFNYTQKMEDIDLALFWAHMSLSTTLNPASIEYVMRQQHLASLYSSRYAFIRNPDDLQAAITLCQESIGKIPQRHQHFFQCHYNLSYYLFHRHINTGAPEDLENSIEYCLKVMKGSPPNNQHTGIYAAHLASALAERYQKSGRLDDLESAMKWIEVAIPKFGKDHPKAPWHLYVHSTVLLLRYRRHRNRADLELSIRQCKSSVELTRPDDPELLERQQQLSILYQDLFSQSRDLQHVMLALEVQQTVVDLTLRDHRYAADHFSTLAAIHSQIYEHKGGVEHREASMKWNHTALDSAKPDDPERHCYYFNLALQYYNRYTRLKDPDDLEVSLKLGNEALRLIPQDHPRTVRYHDVVAEASADRYNLLHDLPDRDKALESFKRSVQASNGDPKLVWRVIRKWAEFAQLHKLPECIDAYGTGYRMLPELFWLGSDITSRHETLVKFEVATVTTKAIAACIEYEQLERAVEFVEQSLALTFQQLLDLQTDLSALKEKFPGYASMLETISADLQKIAITTRSQSPYGSSASRSSQWDLQRKLAMKRDALLKTVRELPEFENFLLPVPFRSLRRAADKGPLVVINCSSKTCDAVIMSQGGKLLHTRLRGVSVDNVAKQYERLRMALRQYGIHSRDVNSHDRAGQRVVSKQVNGETIIQDILAWIWSLIVFPVFTVLKENGIVGGRLWWCLTGPLTYLPLHAAGPPNDFIQSYTSTLGALLRARSSPPRSKEIKVTTVGLSEFNKGGISHLPKVSEEIDALRDVAGESRTSVFMNSDATLEKITDLLPQSTWLHLACHGQQGNAQDPLKSGLLLYEGQRLELETIVNTAIPNAEFVFLSACETAMGDVDLTSESLHLAGGMIFAGFKAVIGTLWSINDADGPVVTRIVYSHLFQDGKEPDVNNAAEALHLAVKHLRERGVPPHRWVPFIHIGI
ncbi:unnamed protein product [Cyclocybe aegerita]|uniref:CHAT domain-containing protein n=1 Tax=Cyclocybe aegerita TaxID=1973307 RepID=A0A8S0WVX4_CYCAE|nr:unnamed protein product [Cyclocybe aegerita]